MCPLIQWYIYICVASLCIFIEYTRYRAYIDICIYLFTYMHTCTCMVYRIFGYCNPRTWPTEKHIPMVAEKKQQRKCVPNMKPIEWVLQNQLVLVFVFGFWIFRDFVCFGYTYCGHTDVKTNNCLRIALGLLKM